MLLQEFQTHELEKINKDACQVFFVCHISNSNIRCQQILLATFLVPHRVNERDGSLKLCWWTLERNGRLSEGGSTGKG